MIAASNRLTFRVNRKDMTYRTRLYHQYSDIEKGAEDKITFVSAPFLVVIRVDNVRLKATSCA